MNRLVLTVVAALPVEAAESRLRVFVERQSELWNRLSSDDVVVTNIRGAGPSGEIVGKRSYQVTVSEEDVSLFRPSDAGDVIEVIVFPWGIAEDIVPKFAAWWDKHVLLRRALGDDGYVMDRDEPAGGNRVRYRVFVRPSQVPLLGLVD